MSDEYVFVFFWRMDGHKLVHRETTRNHFWAGIFGSSINERPFAIMLFASAESTCQRQYVSFFRKAIVALQE